MSGAFLALWNDYPSAMTEEYEAWHTFEHVPERLTAPGMLGARRYASFLQTKNRYFTLYDLSDLSAIEHPAYMDLVKNPTVWSAKMRQHFSNVLRIPASTLASGGRGIGRCSLVQAYSVGRAEARSAGLRLANHLNEMVLSGILLGFLIGLAEPNQPYEVFVQNAETEDDTYNIVLVLEGVCRQTLESARSSINEAAQSLLKPRKSLQDEIFDLVVAYPGNTLPPDRASVTAPPELRTRFDF
uniref:hypothetical protein n=1 Tax=Neorhizobium sp. EC2-8 TaxID=3129230 RepID=UPI00310173BF